MKKLLLALLIPALVACGGDSDSSDAGKDTDAVPAADPNDITKNPDYKAGMAIEAKQDCATCHRIDEKLQGPSYREIAAKYHGQDTAVNYLAGKIIKGGSGVWGQIPMTPHPTLTEEEARTLARYVLLMKK